MFRVNYLGGDMPTFTLNFSRPGNQVVGQYYNFLRLGRAGYTQVMGCLSHTPGRRRVPPGRSPRSPGRSRVPPGRSPSPPGRSRLPPGRSPSPPGRRRLPPGPCVP